MFSAENSDNWGEIADLLQKSSFHAILKFSIRLEYVVKESSYFLSLKYSKIVEITHWEVLKNASLKLEVRFLA